ncbi:MAG: FecR family protein [Gemmatimonadaceae bacterium]
MPASFSPIDAATIAALNAGDEGALESIYRSHHAVLLERALERLKDEPAAAPRLIVATVRELWGERAEFRTSADIEAFLNEELRNRAGAARARMAAVHRFEKSEGVVSGSHAAPPTADRIWAEIASALHKPVTDPETAARARREHAKHDAAGHIAGAVRERSVKGPLLLGALGLVVLAAAVYFINRASRESVVTEMLAAAATEPIMTRSGQLGSVDLPDSSLARLGAESRLVVIPRFGRKYRTLAVDGSAAFTVEPGNAVPFEARVGDMAVISTGGAFSVRDYEDEPMRMVRAVRGEVTVRTPGGTRTLEEGQALAIPRGVSEPRDATAEEAERAFSWADGRLVLRDVSVAEATQQFRRWYGMDVAVPDSAVAARRLTLDVPLETSQSAIDATERGAKVKFLWEDGKMVFRDAGAAGRRAPRR